MAKYIDALTQDGVQMSINDTRMTIAGTIDSKEPGKFMTQFINDYHKNIIDNKIKSIIVDISALEFLNSSGIKEFVSWIMEISRLPEDKKYQVTFICNNNISWQKLSISTLIELKPDVVNINFLSDKNTEKGIFPISIKCHTCNRGLKAPKPGKFKCPFCSGVIIVDDMGKVFKP